MGRCKTIVGTLPVVPPEALVQQPLDGRSDLYSIGGDAVLRADRQACVPGAEHFTAGRAVAQAFASGFEPCSGSARGARSTRHVALSIDVLARPRSAAEVIERLTAIAGLSEDEQLAVSHAYLSTPELVGRSSQLERVHVRLGELIARRGGAIAIVGASGWAARACWTRLHSKPGWVGFWSRARARPMAPALWNGERTVARARRARRATAIRRTATNSVLSLLMQGRISAETDKLQRLQLQTAVVDVLRAAARTHAVLLAVDDIERCDEPSQAALAAAAHAIRNDRIAIATTFVSGVELEMQRYRSCAKWRRASSSRR